jgi:prolyl-tRNA editing enzyme YbaK/EbsC (Cys-tRNA(Pro) deacylase)
MNNSEIMVAEIDPAYMGGKELCEHYGVNPNEGANCVIVEAVYADHTNKVAVIVPVGYRTDLNGLVRKHLGAKKISLANLETVLAETGMEYGSITPFGLPGGYKILVDSRLMENEKIIVGGGRQVSKLLVPTSIFLEIGAEIIENLSNTAY